MPELDGQYGIPSIALAERFGSAKVLVVDDEALNIRLLEVILERAGYRDIYSSSDPRNVLDLMDAIGPDAILLDLAMPYIDGYELLRIIREERGDHSLPILVLTADATPAAKYRALQTGASDFLTKPFDELEVLLRLKNLLAHRFRSVVLEETVRERTRDIRSAHLETLHRLAIAAEYRDDETGVHTQRVGIVSQKIAERMGLPKKECELIGWAAPLHDVGKIAVPDGILLKRGPLTPEEYEIMKRHTHVGAKILSGSRSPLLQAAEEIARWHHERWNGNGYHGLKGDEIPRNARIVAIADAFDALTHARPYKAAWPTEEALTEIERELGRQFDPTIGTIFLELCRSGALDSLESLVGELRSKTQPA